MKAKVIYKALSLIVALLVAAFAVGYAFAWLVNRKDADFDLNGSSAGAYFDSGSGSADDPFVIANRIHMRNLAVLQNTGRFTRDGKQDKYYFKIKDSVDTIDMDGMYIPPIGNDTYPFISEFDGRGKTIANLKVTTNKDELGDDYPVQSADDYQFSRAVGLFGMTGGESEIRNFILDNPTVNVSSTNTSYSAGANQAVGIAIGHVAYKCSSIGVRATNTSAQDVNGTSLNVGVAGYSTFNSILGELGDGVTSSVTGGGYGNGSGGSGAAFGSSLDVNALLKRLQSIYKGKYGVDYKKSDTPEGTPIDNGLPLIDTANSNPVPATGEKVAFTVDSEKSDYSYTANAKEVVGSQNIGYFLGNQNKIQSSNIKFGDTLIEPSDKMNGNYADADGKTPAQSGTTPRQFFKVKGPNGNYTMQTLEPMSEEEFNELPEGIRNIIPQTNSTAKVPTIRLQQRYSGNISVTNTSQNDGWAYHGKISYMGKEYGTSDTLYDTGGIVLPNNAIWFKPAQAGKFRFVIYSGSDGKTFKLIKVIRNSATEENPFAGSDVSGTTVTDNSLGYTNNLSANLLYYFEYDVSDNEIKAGNVEFMLTMGDDNGAYFVYLDIGASAAEDVSTVVPEKSVSAVDFVYDGVSISESEDEDASIKIGDFILSTSGEKYEASKTSIVFKEASTALKIVFIRLHSRDDKKTLNITGSEPTPSTSGDIKATVPAYVIPDVGAMSGGGTSSSGGNAGGETTDPTPDEKPITGITVTGANGATSINTGETLQLSAQVSPSDTTEDTTVSWKIKTDGTGGASISGSGLLTAGGSAGTIVVTASAGTVEQDFTVAVTAPIQPGETVTLDLTISEAVLNISSDGLSITSGKKYKNANLKLNGSSSSTKSIIGNGDGAYPIVFTATDAMKVEIVLALADGNSSKTKEGTISITSSKSGVTYGDLSFTGDTQKLVTDTLTLNLSAGEEITISNSAGRIAISEIKYTLVG